MRKTIFYMFLLIAGYLALVHFGGFSADLGATQKLATGSITALQGR